MRLFDSILSISKTTNQFSALHFYTTRCNTCCEGKVKVRGVRGSWVKARVNEVK